MEDDKVVQPAHYVRWKIEPITFCITNDLDFVRGNVIKYTMRAGHKQYDDLSLEESEIRDLEKARRYLEMKINHLKGEETL